MEATVVAAVDPGTTNFAAWVGKFDQDAGRVSTVAMLHGVPQDETADDKGKTKKKAVYAITADCTEMVADICERSKVANIIVETAPQWNVPVRISAATAYGVFRGRKLPVTFSGPTTKSKAMMMFAEKLGIVPQLEKIPPEWNRMDKTVSSKVRLINTRNAGRVVEVLLQRSNDTAGLDAFKSSAQKHDMADSLLLACGGVMKKARATRTVRPAARARAQQKPRATRVRATQKSKSKKNEAAEKKPDSSSSETEEELL